MPAHDKRSVRKDTKCDMCGSTAIDHTEMHCQLNRLKVTQITTVPYVVGGGLVKDVRANTKPRSARTSITEVEE